jgi:hypothetical protein
MNVTASLMGDPPKGRSALDQRKGGTGITLASNPPTWNAKLTAEKVAMIRASSESTRVLAEQFGISVRSMSDVRAGRSWKHA